VRFAVQRAMAERNAVLPAEQQLVFRIGVNLGDIIVEDGDIHGDGVNRHLRPHFSLAAVIENTPFVGNLQSA
jgi:class 3 adenylate cyclase